MVKSASRLEFSFSAKTLCKKLRIFECFSKIDDSMVPGQCLQCLQQRRRGRLYFRAVLACKFFKQALPFGSEMNNDLPPVVVVTRSHHQPAVFSAVNQFDRAVVLKLKPLCQIAHPGLLPWGQAANRQQKLVLLRMQPRPSCCFLAEAQEAAYLIAKFRLGDKCSIKHGERFYFIS